MKRGKVLRIELRNPERKLYCLALIIANEQVNKKVNRAADIFRNVARYMEETDADEFVASCLSRAGFGMGDSVDVVGKLGHLERLCEAVVDHYGYALPEYQAVSGYAPVAAVHRKLKQAEIEQPEFIDKEDQDAPWMRGSAKSEWR